MSQKGNFDIYQKTRSSTLGKKTNDNIIAYENLANAIVLKAVRDYQHALIQYHLFFSTDAERKIKDLERFFRSGWYKLLTSIDGDYMIKIAKKQVEDRDWKRFDMGSDD